MLRSTAFLRPIAWLAILLPCAAGCGLAVSGGAPGGSGDPSEAGTGSGGGAAGNAGSGEDDGGFISLEAGADAGTDTTAPALVAPLGPAPVLLGAAGNYAILAKAAITNVPTSRITGDLGVSPAAADSITGFAMTQAGTKWTSTQVTGSIFAASSDPPTPTNLTTAVSNMEAAYVDASGRPAPTALDVGGGEIGGLTLKPGLYKWDTAVTISSDVTISGAPNDVWIFQISGPLTMSAAKAMILTGGAKAKNVFWQVAGYADLGAAAHAEGILVSKTAITLGTGASVNGRLFAQTAVTLAGNIITAPAP